MKSIKLNTSDKFKNNKFQIKYLKAKKNNIVLFATYFAYCEHRSRDDWSKKDNIFYRAYDFFMFFNRNKRAVCYIGNNSAYQYYSFISNNNINSFMNSFQRNASEFLNKIIDKE